MTMAVRSKRGVAILVLTLLAFSQASVPFHACAMDRGAMNAAMASGSDKTGDGCEAAIAGQSPQDANLCVLHCTSDLQTAGASIALIGASNDPPLLAVVRAYAAPESQTGLLTPPAGAPPHRILLHCFLI